MAHAAWSWGSGGPAAVPTPGAVLPLEPAAAGSGLSSGGLVSPGVCAGSAAAGHGSGLNPSPPDVKTPRERGRAPAIAAEGVRGAEAIPAEGWAPLHCETQTETPGAVLAGARVWVEKPGPELQEHQAPAWGQGSAWLMASPVCCSSLNETQLGSRPWR